jgi:hypothetical protein
LRWIEIWKRPLLDAITSSNEAHIRLLNKYFLPNLSKNCPQAFTDLLKGMGKDVIETQQTENLQALMVCLNITCRNNILPGDRIPLAVLT